MEIVAPIGADQGIHSAGNFVVYAGFNCPYCYALNERLYVMSLEQQVDFRIVQKTPSASSENPQIEELIGLTREVAELRRRAPSVQIAVPQFRPGTELATRLMGTVSCKAPLLASLLRRRIYRALWVEGLDISRVDVLKSLLAELDIDSAMLSASRKDASTTWQSEWESDAEFERKLPVVISERGEKIVGFPLEPELNAFLQTGTLVSDMVMHDLTEYKPLQRIVVLDDDVPSLQMLLEQMNNVQIEIVEDFASLISGAHEDGLPDLVLVNTDMVEDSDSTNWWHNSSDLVLDGAVPVIFLSDGKSTEAEITAFEAGAADFIAKPFHPRVLQARLNMHLQARESQRQLNNIARVDALTGICNRREFDLRLMSEWSRGARTGQSLALLMIDVDKFKQYNDHYGHLRGDECLVTVAQILNNCTQRTSDLIARYGGEEFVALLPDSDLEGALTVAEDCLAALEAAALPHANSDVDACVTVSVGIAAMLPLHDKSSTILIEQADVALYQAKQNGRNRICSFNEWS